MDTGNSTYTSTDSQNGGCWSDSQSLFSEFSGETGYRLECDKYQTEQNATFDPQILGRAFQRTMPDLTANIMARDYLDHLVAMEVISFSVMKTITSISGSSEMARELLYQITSRDGGCMAMMKLFLHRDINQSHLYEKVMKEYLKCQYEKKQQSVLRVSLKAEPDSSQACQIPSFGKYAEFKIEVMETTKVDNKSVSTNVVQFVKALLKSKTGLLQRLRSELHCMPAEAEDVLLNENNYLQLVTMQLSVLRSVTADDGFEWVELSKLISDAWDSRTPDTSIKCYVTGINISSFISANHKRDILERLGKQVLSMECDVIQDRHLSSTLPVSGSENLLMGTRETPIMEHMKSPSHLHGTRNQSGSGESFGFLDSSERNIKWDHQDNARVRDNTAVARIPGVSDLLSLQPNVEGLQYFESLGLAGKRDTVVSSSSVPNPDPAISASSTTVDDLLDFGPFDSNPTSFVGDRPKLQKASTVDILCGRMDKMNPSTHDTDSEVCGTARSNGKLQKMSTIDTLFPSESGEEHHPSSHPEVSLTRNTNTAQASNAKKSKTGGPLCLGDSNDPRRYLQVESASTASPSQDEENSDEPIILEAPEGPKSPDQFRKPVPSGLLEILRKVPIGVGKGRSKSNEVMNRVVRKILEVLQDEQEIVIRPEFAGSSFEGAKTESADEFDVLIVLNGKDLDRTRQHPLYATLKPRNQDNVKFKDYLSAEGYLDPAKIRSKVISWVKLAINKYFPVSHEIKVELSQNGPAVTLSIEPNENAKSKSEEEFSKIDVDLVPAFLVLDEYYVTKPCKVELRNSRDGCFPKKEILWRKSFSLQEKQRLHLIDKDGGCRRQCLRILKFLRVRESTLKCLDSYHYKILLLNECANLPAAKAVWSKDKLAERFWGLLDSLVSYLEQKSLPHCIEKDINLFEEMKPSALENIRTRLMKITNKGVDELSKIFGKPPIP